MDFRLHTDGTLVTTLEGGASVVLRPCPEHNGYRVEVSGRARGVIVRRFGGWHDLGGQPGHAGNPGEALSIEAAIVAVYRGDVARTRGFSG